MTRGKVRKKIYGRRDWRPSFLLYRRYLFTATGRLFQVDWHPDFGSGRQYSGIDPRIDERQWYCFLKSIIDCFVNILSNGGEFIFHFYSRIIATRVSFLWIGADCRKLSCRNIFTTVLHRDPVNNFLSSWNRS